MFHRRTELCKAITIYIVRFHGGSHIKWTSLIWNNHTDRFQDFDGKAHNNNTTTAEQLEKNILCRFQIIKRIWHKKVMWCDILPNIDFFCCCCSTKSKKNGWKVRLMRTRRLERTFIDWGHDFMKCLLHLQRAALFLRHSVLWVRH